MFFTFESFFMLFVLQMSVKRTSFLLSWTQPYKCCTQHNVLLFWTGKDNSQVVWYQYLYLWRYLVFFFGTTFIPVVSSSFLFKVFINHAAFLFHFKWMLYAKTDFIVKFPAHTDHQLISAYLQIFFFGSTIFHSFSK